MIYQRITHTDDPDIPSLAAAMRLPEIARFIHIDEQNFWNYVTSSENVFYYKVYDHGCLSAALHAEISDGTLYPALMVLPQYQRQGIAAAILRDLQTGSLPLEFSQIEATVDAANAASIALFEKMNFACVSDTDGLRTYRYSLAHQ